MAFTYTVDQMLESIKMRARIPASQTTYTDAKLRRLIDEELELHVLPRLMKVRENYFLVEEDESIVSGTAEYRIPDRAAGGKISVLKMVDAQDNEKLMHQIPYEDALNYQNGDYNEPRFYIKGNNIVLVPTPNRSTDRLRWGYYRKPSSCVELSAVGTITNIDTSLNKITVSAMPSTITSSTPVDLVRSSGGFECLAINQSVAVVGNTATFSSLPAGLEVGDYLCLAEETPVPQIPADIHSYLTLRVAKVVLEGLGFLKEADNFEKDLKLAESIFDSLLTPRTDGNPKKIINWFSPHRR